MGLIKTEIELVNSTDFITFDRGLINENEVRRTSVTALVDSGSYMLAINEKVNSILGLRKLSEQNAELADGSVRLLDIVGPVEINFKNRSTSCRAMVLPGEAEVLLGSIPMEDLDVIIDPKRQIMDVNPDSPNIAKKSLK